MTDPQPVVLVETPEIAERGPVLHVVSMSGGKDSTATALLSRETVDPETIIYAFADTGNEHPLTYEYLVYLEAQLGISIVRLRRSFDAEIAHRREWLKENGDARGYTLAAIDRALAVLVPSGNPYLDLCMYKGRFPSRKAQFCTQFLKTEPLVEYQMGLIDEGFVVWSWQGIRADEGGRRRFAASFEEVGGGLFINRPILRWSAADTFEAMRVSGIEPNPLYKLGMGRVGCMPCINANKAEIGEIAARFPEQIERILEWERLVTQASKREAASFFLNPDREAHLNKRGIINIVEWSKTTRGGKQFDLLTDPEPTACSSSYGLCE